MLNANDLDTLLFCAFRYALGRRTYIVHEIATILLDNKERLSRQTLSKIIEEIYGRIMEGSAGLKCDVIVWENLAVYLERYLQGDGDVSMA